MLVVGGTWTYINLIKDDAPERLALAEAPEEEAEEAPVALDGTWSAGPGSTVGYRVQEVLFGQETEGVGRTEEVVGTVAVEGTTVAAAQFEVAGSVPIVFEEWGISNPSNVAASVGDSGTLEVLLVLGKA